MSAVKQSKRNGKRFVGQVPIRILKQGVIVQPLIEQIDLHPELWDDNVFRTHAAAEYAGPLANPHKKISDIVCRFNDWKNWTGDRAAFNEEHESVWWAPYEKLTYLKPLVFDLMRLLEAEHLGMVLITRIPPFSSVGKHIDAGWHAQHYLKCAVQLKAAPGQRFCYDELKLETAPGDLYVFDNSKPHWVENPTEFERWTLIICLRLQQPVCRECSWDGS